MSSGGIAGWFNNDLVAHWTQILADTDAFGDGQLFADSLRGRLEGKTYSQRLVHFANAFDDLTGEYSEKVKAIAEHLGPANELQTGTFSNFYWVLPFSKYVELYGLEHLEESLAAIEQITMRSTGEYALRPFATHFPDQVLRQCEKWALDHNFHVRRLASEGIRPRLPWARRLDCYSADPNPVFDILEVLVRDPVPYVQRSVANHAADYLHTHPELACERVDNWRRDPSPGVHWIIKRFDTRKAKLTQSRF